MAYFLTREEQSRPVGGRSMAGRPPPVPAPPAYAAGPADYGNPGSPLSRLVNQGYNRGGEPSQGFNAGVAQQWSNNVGETRAAHQQKNDPTFVEKKAKSHGVRVSCAPGGGSSISLSWDPDSAPAQQDRRGRGAGEATPLDHGAARAVGGGARVGCQAGGPIGGGAWGAPESNGPTGLDRIDRPEPTYRLPSPGGPAAGRGLPRSSSRDGGMAGCLGGAVASNPCSREGKRPGCVATAAYDSKAQPYGGANAYGGAPPFPAAPPVQAGGGPFQREANGLAFGGRSDSGSSNAYANGANQNCGNGITDRRTTRVAEPPGGRSQISFG